MTKTPFVLQADLSEDEIAEWVDIATGPYLAGLLQLVESGDAEIPVTGFHVPLRIVNVDTEMVVAAKRYDGTWEVDYDGLNTVKPPIDYTAFALSLLDKP